MTRWTPQRKAEVCAIVLNGGDVVTIARLHGLAPDELRAWVARFERRGPRGLYVGDRDAAR